RAKRAGQLHARELPELIKEAIKLGILSESDKSLLAEAERLRSQVIEVNAFEKLMPTGSGSAKQQSKVSTINKLGAA
ncbi:MAG: DUF1974 domain-containing protein, partial [Candidatus Thiodiazotropha taylori]|nr:DUF1974 domain-containing protein [Candidatus Thiodiazotropha taylori]MCW4253330.1 DUF1974 domain-containing protein [Candidatus Thiodiazotropha taylori]